MEFYSLNGGILAKFFLVFSILLYVLFFLSLCVPKVRCHDNDIKDNSRQGNVVRVCLAALTSYVAGIDEFIFGSLYVHRHC